MTIYAFNNTSFSPPSQEILQLSISNIIAGFETYAYRLGREPVDTQINFKRGQNAGST